MGEVATTKLSSRGQIVIPEEIRSRLGLEPGARFVVVGEGDVVVLKAIQAPSMDQFDELVGQARRAAFSSGMELDDISRAIREARKAG